MDRVIINTNKAPDAIGPYSQGIKIGNLIFTSGQLPVDMSTGKLVENDVKEATKASLDNVKAIIEEAGSCLEKVVKTVIYLKDMNDFSAVNDVYAIYFKELGHYRCEYL